MTQTDTQASREPGKGKRFFDRADQLAETGNWDYAIEMYLEGIRREPDNIEHGHKRLREVSLKRKAQGGKNAGLGEKLKHSRAKEPLDKLINAEYLLAKEPGSITYMDRVLKAAISLELRVVNKWICEILLETQRQANKPSMKVLMMLIKACHDNEEYALGIQACGMAQQLNPDSNELQEAMSELSAKYTIQKGKYGQEGDFAKGVADMDKQKELAQSDMLAQSKSFLEQEVQKARKGYQDSPTVPGKINGLVDALLKFEDESYENEATDVLTKAYADLSAYHFKMRIGDIKMRQMTRRYRKLVEQGDKQKVTDQLRLQLAFELEEYTERAANYPTDMSIKYELGRRQLLAGKYDDAISSLQQAQRDPKRHLMALNFLGQAFAKKQWFQEASETYERALQAEMPETRIKELRYNLGDCLEKMDRLKEAQHQFSEVAQIDYNYKDARQRLENVRKKIDAGQGKGDQEQE